MYRGEGEGLRRGIGRDDPELSWLMQVLLVFNLYFKF